MKLYLSSYKLGNKTQQLKEMTLSGKMAYIPNALDFSDDLERRKESEEKDINQLSELGIDVERVDLRDYFNQPEVLKKKMMSYNSFWVRGGNVFILRQAMKKSGFDLFIKEMIDSDILYGGYSAGICILAPTLRGLEIVDETIGDDTIWEGLNIIDYSIIPHYQSNHPESEKVEEVVRYMKDNNLPFETLRDGEVIIN